MTKVVLAAAAVAVFMTKAPGPNQGNLLPGKSPGRDLGGGGGGAFPWLPFLVG